MATQDQVATLLPYRDINNQQVCYAPLRLRGNLSSQDSDEEPLIQGATPNELDEDSIMRFTATGRPLTNTKYYAGPTSMYAAPVLLPKRYTDDSIIPAIIVNVIPSTTSPVKKPKGGILRRLSGGAKDGAKGLTKVVYMPRREYLKYFARGLSGEFIGTEQERRWSEDELEEIFGKYKPVAPKRRPS